MMVQGRTLSFEPKFFLKSKTVLGIIIALVGAIVGHFGLPVDDAEIATFSSALLELVGFVLAVFGRVTAKQSLTVKGKCAGKALLLVLLVPVFLVGAGCAEMQKLPVDEQMSVIASHGTKTYESLHSKYLQLEQTLPPDGVAYLQTKVAPALDAAKHSQIAFESAVLAWRRTQVEPGNIADLRADVDRYLTEVAALLAGLTEKSEEVPDGN
ncbi:MAG: hypothetical protein ACNI3A_18660 [Desulfovibrio sp.]|uniref:hypothetical protein n=1 Tax=Desulfovibrio sp. 7SRBS1 TaxID=3378064 RepID=UPI003B40C3A5